MEIRDNLAAVLAAIRTAEVKAGRIPGSVRLVAVSKTYTAQAVAEAASAGQMDFGENRVQELVEKQASMPALRWHMIGTLQRNKVRHIVPFVHLIHSVDSLPLLQEIDRQGSKQGRQVDCLLQVNISDEPQKGGFSETEAESALQNISDYPHIHVKGLMGMAELTDDKQAIQMQFRRLRLAAERFTRLCGPQVKMSELSMGMSSDFEEAIAEGATMVRIGSSIFGTRKPN